MAKTVHQRKSSRPTEFVSISMFRALESELLQMRDALDDVRQESSCNLRRCGQLQSELDALKKESSPAFPAPPLHPWRNVQ